MRPHLTFANVVAVIALFVALGGTAIATHPGGRNTISSPDIVNGEVKLADVGPGAVATSELADDAIKAADIGSGEVRTAEIANGQVKPVDLAAAAIGARAYARVDPDDCVASSCTPRESKGISSVTVEQAGIYCLTAPGINGNVTPAAATVDWQNTSNPEGNASAMTYELGGCGTSGRGFAVVTERQPQIAVDAGGGVNNATAAGTPELAADVAFSIVIP